MKTRLLIMSAACMLLFALIPNVEALREVLTVDEMSKRSDAIAVGTVQSSQVYGLSRRTCRDKESSGKKGLS